MRKISELLTISRKYHAASNGVGRKQAEFDWRYNWGLCDAAIDAEEFGDITRIELHEVLSHIGYYVMDGKATYLSTILGTECPHELSAWWDNHIAGLIEAGR